MGYLHFFVWFGVRYESQSERLLVTLVKAKNLAGRGGSNAVAAAASNVAGDFFVRLFVLFIMAVMLALLIRAAISSSSDGDAFEDSVLPSSICVSYRINSQPLNRTELNPRARVLLDQFSIHLFSYLNIRHQFFPNRIVDIWNSSPAAVAPSPSVAVFIRNKCKKLNSLKHPVRTTVAGSHN